jgi:hypothetical protein
MSLILHSETILYFDDFRENIKKGIVVATLDSNNIFMVQRRRGSGEEREKDS